MLYKYFLLIPFIGNLINSNFQTRKDFISQSIPSDKSSPYVYSPKNCPYQVTFPEKPEILSQDVFTNENNLVSSEIAGLEFPSQITMLKAEFILLKQGLSNYEGMRDLMKGYAYFNGLSNVNITHNENSKKNIYELRGYKNLSSGPATYTGFFYFKNKIVFILYGGCPSKSYPTKAITNFYSSFKEK